MKAWKDWQQLMKQILNKIMGGFTLALTTVSLVLYSSLLSGLYYIE